MTNYSKSDIMSLFVSKGILSRNHPDKRTHSWRSRMDMEAMAVWGVFRINYRSDDEAWFCLCKNVEPEICPVCGIEKVKFAERHFNTVCCHCSANAVPEKKELVKQKMRSRTDAEWSAIQAKKETTCIERYGCRIPNAIGSEEFYVNNERLHGDRHYCNRQQIVTTHLKNHGGKWNLQNPEFIQQSIQTKIERYGNGCNLEKRYRTNLSKYGVKNFVQTEEFRVKAHNTLVEHYGSVDESYSQRYSKTKQTKLERYGSETYHNVVSFATTLDSKRREFETLHDCTSVPELTARFGQGWHSLQLPRLFDKSGNAYVENCLVKEIELYASEKHGIPNKSTAERFIFHHIMMKYPGLEVRSGDRTALRTDSYTFKELDIYLPSISVGIEYNGVYWHSVDAVGKMYHQEKTELARSLGIKLLHIFEPEFLQEPQKVLDLVDSCISEKFNNVLEVTEDGCIVGDNSKPIFGDVVILSITEPSPRVFSCGTSKLTVFDCGKVIYKRINQENEHVT